MQNFKIKISSFSWKEIVLVIVMPIFFLFQENWISYFLLLFITILILLSYTLGKKELLFAFLLLQSYHSEGISVYTTNFLGISFIYFILLFILVYEFHDKVYFPKILITFTILFPARVMLGFYYKIDTFSWIVETILFFAFLIFCVTVYNYSLFQRDNLVRILKNYVLYYFPYLTLISLFFASEIDYSGKFVPYYFDEFSGFYIISIFPIILIGTKKIYEKSILLIIHLLFIYIQLTYLYVGSFALIGLILTLITMMFLYFKKHLKYLFLVGALILVSGYVLKDSNNFVKFKIAQVSESFKFFIDSPSLNKIKNIPNSPRTRIIEYLNIQSEIYESGPLTFLMGKGFGSYFTDKNYSFNEYEVVFHNNSAFSEKEITLNKFSRPHNTFFYMPLKLGFFGVSGIIIIVLFLFVKVDKDNWMLYSFTSYILIFFDSGIKSFIFVGCMMAILLKTLNTGNKIG